MCRCYNLRVVECRLAAVLLTLALGHPRVPSARPYLAHRLPQFSHPACEPLALHCEIDATRGSWHVRQEPHGNPCCGDAQQQGCQGSRACQGGPHQRLAQQRL